MCVWVSVWLGWSGIRVILLLMCSTCFAGWSLQHGYHSNPTTPKHQHTSNQEHTTNVVIQQNSRKLLVMDILISETCRAHKKWNKNSKWHQVGLLFSTITTMHGPINISYSYLCLLRWILAVYYEDIVGLRSYFRENERAVYLNGPRRLPSTSLKQRLSHWLCDSMC